MPKDAAPADLAAAVADFGAELESLGSDPAAEGRLPAAVAGYREAVVAHDRALALLRRAPDSWRDGKIVRILKVGRAALDRWYALGGEQPKPADAPPPAPVAAPGDSPRFRYSGAGRPSGKTELAIDRPEPGLPTVARIVMGTRAPIAVRTRTHHGDEFTTGGALVDAYGPIDRLALLADGPTHLLVDSKVGRLVDRVAPARPGARAAAGQPR